MFNSTYSNFMVVTYKEYKGPLHTLLAASAEVLPLQLPMLVVMVMVVKVQVFSCGRTGARCSVDDVFC